MGLNHDDVATRWIGRVLHGERGLKAENHNMFAEGDSLYSYGHHFELARVLRDKKGNPTHFLINGDTFSNTTSRHQAATRAAISRTGLPSVIIPHTVLNSAGIEESSVRIIDVLPDRTIRRERTYTEMQRQWQWRDVEEFHFRDPSLEEKTARLAKINAQRYKDWLTGHEFQWAADAIEKGDLFNWYINRYGMPPKILKHEDMDTWGYGVTGRTGATWSDCSKYHAQVKVHDYWEKRLFSSHYPNATEIDVEYVGGEPISYTQHWERHVLGEALVEGTIAYTVRLKCKECGGTGARPVVAEANGYYAREVERDLADIHAKGVGSFSDYRSLEYNQTRLEENLLDQMACPTCYHGRWSHTHSSRGTGRVTVTRRRKALFLSGFDHNEPRLMYFFSELPTRKPRTVQEAYDSLMPETVKMAVQMGRAVHRQGDIFAVPMPTLTKQELADMGARFERMGQLLGTNHVATETAYLKDGRTFARGILHHKPEFRRPDHVRVYLEKDQWHLVLKNTVPVSA